MNPVLREELLRIDEAWKAEAESFKVSYGRRDVVPRLPSAGDTVMCVILGTLGIAGGVVSAVLFAHGGFFPFLLGTILAPASLGMIVYYVSVYCRYKSAYRAYQRRRAQAIAKPRESRSG